MHEMRKRGEQGMDKRTFPLQPIMKLSPDKAMPEDVQAMPKIIARKYIVPSDGNIPTKEEHDWHKKRNPSPFNHATTGLIPDGM